MYRPLFVDLKRSTQLLMEYEDQFMFSEIQDDDDDDEDMEEVDSPERASKQPAKRN